MSPGPEKTQLAVVGAGPGGYAAAFLAADLGLDVTLIDREPDPGGVCLYRGCIPSKALLHVARVLDESRQAAAWGVKFGSPKIDRDKLRAWKDSVVAKQTRGLGELAKRRKIRYVQGSARLLDAHTLQIEPASAESTTLAFEHAVLASGSSPAAVPGLQGESSRFLDSTSALDLEGVPGSLLVVGGGYIGLELGTVYAALGSRVTVVEMMPGLLPGVDADLVRPLARRLEQRCEAILVNTKVAAAKPQRNGVKVTLEGEGLEKPERRFDKLLIAVGRSPNSAGLGLENTRVEVDASGFVKVDERLRTAEPSIYAIGDLVGEPLLAHKATHQGRTAAEAIAGHKVAFEPRAIPAVVFTDPEIAWCGLTEAEAKRQGREVAVARFPWAASGRAATLGRDDGLTKLILDPATERVLGVGICGPGAGELIAEGVLAVEMAALASDIKLSIHPHPTLSETVMEAAEVFFGQSTHVYRPKRKG